MSNDSDSYRYPPTGKHLTRVSKYLDETDGKQRYLVPWCERITAEHDVDNLAQLAALLKDEGRQAAVDYARGQSEAIRSIKRDTGSYVHRVVEALILWQASPKGRGSDLTLPVLPEHLAGADFDGLPVEDVADIMLTGFLNFVADFRPQFLAAEMTVFNEPLGYAGTLDAIATFPGLAIGRAGRFIPGGGVTPCLDFKTGKHLDVTVPEQITAYRHAPEAMLPLGELIRMPPTDAGGVVHLRPEYPRGYRVMLVSPADDAAAWNRFRRAVELYQGRKAVRAKPGKVCYPLRADGTIQSPRLADLDGEGYGQALAPLIKALGPEADLEQLAAMDAGDCLKVKGIGGKLLGAIRLMLADHGLALKGEELLTLTLALNGTVGQEAA